MRVPSPAARITMVTGLSITTIMRPGVRLTSNLSGGGPVGRIPGCVEHPTLGRGIPSASIPIWQRPVRPDSRGRTYPARAIQPREDVISVKLARSGRYGQQSRLAGNSPDRDYNRLRSGRKSRWHGEIDLQHADRPAGDTHP